MIIIIMMGEKFERHENYLSAVVIAIYIITYDFSSGQSLSEWRRRKKKRIIIKTL